MNRRCRGGPGQVRSGRGPARRTDGRAVVAAQHQRHAAPGEALVHGLHEVVAGRTADHEVAPASIERIQQVVATDDIGAHFDGCMSCVAFV